VLCPVLIPGAVGRLQAHHGKAESWRLIFAGLTGSWSLAAAGWLFIDASKPLEQ
jgi:hypothetical protein